MARNKEGGTFALGTGLKITHLGGQSLSEFANPNPDIIRTPTRGRIGETSTRITENGGKVTFNNSRQDIGPIRATTKTITVRASENRSFASVDIKKGKDAVTTSGASYAIDRPPVSSLNQFLYELGVQFFGSQQSAIYTGNPHCPLTPEQRQAIRTAKAIDQARKKNQNNLLNAIADRLPDLMIDSDDLVDGTETTNMVGIMLNIPIFDDLTLIRMEKGRVVQIHFSNLKEKEDYLTKEDLEWQKRNGGSAATSGIQYYIDGKRVTPDKFSSKKNRKKR